MELNEYIKRVLAEAKRAGFEAAECCYISGEDMEISAIGGEIDDYSISTSLGLSLRGLYEGKMGYASTRVLDEESIGWLIESAKSSAELVDNDDKEFLFAGSDSYAQVNAFAPELEQITARDKIATALELERATLKLDERIKRVQGCAVVSQRAQTRLVNSLGLDLSHTENAIGAYVSAVAEADGDTATGSAVRFGRNRDMLDTDSLAREAADEALGMLGARPCASGKYAVLLRRDVMAGLLETFAGMFSAEAAQHGLSLLRDREGDRIASPCVTIIDDPLRPDGSASTPFDAEGVATYTKAVVEDGVLRTLLHNLKTANKQGVTTTGNASRPSLGGSVTVAPTNFYIKPGERPFEELLSEVGNGLLVTDIMGMHSGANGISGDFSLGARGYLIKDGRMDRPVKGITIAGNFLELLGNISEVGSDLWFGMPGGSCCGAPSAIVPELSVAGE